MLNLIFVKIRAKFYTCAGVPRRMMQVQPVDLGMGSLFLSMRRERHKSSSEVRILPTANMQPRSVKSILSPSESNILHMITILVVVATRKGYPRERLAVWVLCMRTVKNVFQSTTLVLHKGPTRSMT